MGTPTRWCPDESRVVQQVWTFSSVLLVQSSEGAWSPGIGDPTFVGWFTVVAYLVASAVCWRAWRSTPQQHRELAVAWMLFALLMLGLGINKQLDLQSWLTVVGRQMALEQGWYAERHRVQVQFIRAIVIGGACTLIVSAWLLRHYLRQLWLSAFGAVFIVAFVVVRAASFHRVDVLLGTTLGGARVNWILELGGIACIALGATRYLRSRQR